MKKISVVIADDDHLVLEDLKSLVHWHKLGFHIAATAVSGEEALVCLKKYRPDLLITDIRMRGMNGLEVIETARPLYPDMKFIIISSYDDFEYARRAISNAVIDYILKTEITSVKLTRLLNKVYEVIMQDKAFSNTQFQQELEHFFNTAEEVPCKKLPISVTTKFYFTILAPTYSFSRKTAGHSAEEKSDFQQPVLETALNYCAHPIIFRTSHYLILGIYPEKGRVKTTDILHKFVQALNFRLGGQSVLYVHLYFTHPYTLTEFRMYFHQYQNLFLYYQYFSPGAPVRLSDFNHLSYQPSNLTFSFHPLILDEEHFEQNIFLIKEYLTGVFRCQDIISILQFYQNFCSYLEISANNKLELPDSLYAFTPEHFQKWVYNSLYDCTQFLIRGLKYDFNPIIDSAIEFMKKNYSICELSSSDIAFHVGLSVNRLGVLFKKDTGSTINEYLSNIRVEKAVELLEKTNMKIYEISEKCGYKSSQYFSQIILQKTGKRPIDYRKAPK